MSSLSERMRDSWYSLDMGLSARLEVPVVCVN